MSCVFCSCTNSRAVEKRLKLLAKPSDFLDIEIDRFGDGSDKPRVEIHIQEDTDENIPQLVDKLNQFIDHGYRFTEWKLGGDMIGWKYVKMVLEKPGPHVNRIKEDGSRA